MPIGEGKYFMDASAGQMIANRLKAALVRLAALEKAVGGGVEYTVGTETATGDWLTINGQRKQIYEKYIESGVESFTGGGTLQTATQFVEIAHGISGLGTVIDISGGVATNDGEKQIYMTLPTGDGGSLVNNISVRVCHVDESKVHLAVDGAFSSTREITVNYRCMVRLRYIKDTQFTAPAPSSGGGGNV